MENTNVKENLEPVVIDSNAGVFALTKPIMIDGEKVTEIQYNTDNLTGRDIERAIKELAKRGVGVSIPETDSSLHCQLFAYASNLDYTDIQRLSMVDYVRALGIIRSFFLN